MGPLGGPFKQNPTGFLRPPFLGAGVKVVGPFQLNPVGWERGPCPNHPLQSFADSKLVDGAMVGASVNADQPRRHHRTGLIGPSPSTPPSPSGLLVRSHRCSNRCIAVQKFVVGAVHHGKVDDVRLGKWTPDGKDAQRLTVPKPHGCDGASGQATKPRPGLGPVGKPNRRNREERNACLGEQSTCSYARKEALNKTLSVGVNQCGLFHWTQRTVLKHR